MDVPAGQSARVVVQRIPPAAVGRARRRRRPSGDPPPLPHHLQTSGVGWLIAALVLVVLAIVVFAPWAAGHRRGRDRLRRRGGRLAERVLMLPGCSLLSGRWLP
jgi:hypothetical protein